MFPKYSIHKTYLIVSYSLLIYSKREHTYMAASYVLSLPHLFIKKPEKEIKVGKDRILIPYAYLQSQILSETFKQKQ